MNRLVQQAFNTIPGCKERGAFIFLSFTEEGRGKVWISDSEEISGADDSPDATITRQRLDFAVGEGVSQRVWLAAKKLKGWKD
jgi:hypothetical protein